MCIIYCKRCNKPTQIACLLQQFRQADGSLKKYYHEWLKNFPAFHNMSFVCQAGRTSRIADNTSNISLLGISNCNVVTSLDKHGRNLTSQVDELFGKIVNIGQ